MNKKKLIIMMMLLIVMAFSACTGATEKGKEVNLNEYETFEKTKMAIFEFIDV